jgi:DNA-binding LacI/PurR family transcriptional regulator
MWLDNPFIFLLTPPLRQDNSYYSKPRRMVIISSSPIQFQIERSQSARKQLAQHVRGMIRSGEMPPGFKLPSNKELSQQWQVAGSSVHAALTALVKEGLLERTPKLGTFVAKRTRSLTQVVIYMSDDIWHQPSSAFLRAVVSELSEQLRARDIVPDVWIDLRAKGTRSEPWPELVQAASQRQIQAILMCCGDWNMKWISALPVPLAMLNHGPYRASAFFDHEWGGRLAALELSRQGCRSAGMIVPSGWKQADGGDNPHAAVMSAFRQAATEAGVEVRDEWIQHASADNVDEADAEVFGHETMKHVLEMKERPEGMFVTHDWTARGALTAVLESRVAVPDELKLVLHRNVEVGLLCPLPVSFLDYSVKELAGAMIALVDAQLRGEEPSPKCIRPSIARQSDMSK